MRQALHNTRQRWVNWRNARLYRRLRRAGLVGQVDLFNLQSQVNTLQCQVSYLSYELGQVKEQAAVRQEGGDAAA